MTDPLATQRLRRKDNIVLHPWEALRWAGESWVSWTPKKGDSPPRSVAWRMRPWVTKGRWRGRVITSSTWVSRLKPSKRWGTKTPIPVVLMSRAVSTSSRVERMSRVALPSVSPDTYPMK